MTKRLSAAVMTALGGGAESLRERELPNSGRALLLSKVTEKQWEAQVERWLKRGGWTYYHTWSALHSKSGFPDLVAIRGQEVLWIELKTETGKLGASQVVWRDALLAAGQRWFCWRPSDEAECKRVLAPTVAMYDRIFGTEEDRGRAGDIDKRSGVQPNSAHGVSVSIDAQEI